MTEGIDWAISLPKPSKRYMIRRQGETTIN